MNSLRRMRISDNARLARPARAAAGRAAAAAGTVLAMALSGCGAAAPAANPATSPTANVPATAPADLSANPVAVAPINQATLTEGPASSQIAATIVAFYRAAWQNQPSLACGQFSPTGISGFIRAAAISFPQSVNRGSSCDHAMQIYSATLGDSAATTVANDPSFSTATLDRVGVAYVAVHGAAATAIAPTNVAELINPKQIRLVHTGGRWRIDGSKSLNPSNLKQIVAKAQADGQLKPRG